MEIKKKKLEDMTKEEKGKVLKTSLLILLGVAIFCGILISCFSCTQDPAQPPAPELTNEQKATMWLSNIMDVWWLPQTDDTHDGILKGLFLPRDAHTVYDTETKKTLIYFMFNQDAVMLQAEIVLESESGKLKFVSEDIWDVKFSEKNDIMYMTVTDSDGKTVYYQQK